MTSLGLLLKEIPVWTSELKRRHVFKTAVAYLVGAWIIIEVAATIFPLIPLPSWSASLVVGLAAAGFPIALFLSWVYDLTYAGVVKTEAAMMPPEPVGLRVADVILPATEFPLTRPVAGPASLIPSPDSPLIGRERDVEVVKALLACHRIVTLTGPGGMGKTRLALEVLARSGQAGPNGPWLVELAGLQDPELVASTVARAMGVIPQTERAVPETIAEALGEGDALLVLDNCEHLVASVASMVSSLTTRCAGLRILATSREPLRVAGEAVHGLGPLPVTVSGRGGARVDGAAVRLFESRARAVLPEFRVTAANRDAVRAICTRVDGLPLALELSAARLRLLSPEQIEERLGRSFDLLSGGRRDLPGRHRTMGATIGWSFDLLGPEERRLLTELSIFRGGFEVDAVEAVATVRGGMLLDRLGDLIDRSLVVADAGTAPRRYRLLETVRQYAWSHLDPADASALELRHLEWCALLAETADVDLTGPGARVWLQRLDREMDNMRSAMGTSLARGQVGDALRIAGGLSWFWFRRGHAPEGRIWLERAIQAGGEDAHRPLPRALLGLASLQYLEGDRAGAGLNLDRAARIAASFGDTRTRGRALVTLAYIRAAAGELVAGELAAAEGQALAGDAGHRDVETEAFTALGQIARARGELARAEALLLEGAAGAHEIGHYWQASSASWVAAKVALDRDEPATAVERVGLCIRLMWEEGDKTSTLVGLHTMASALAMRGEPRRGARLLGSVAAAGERIGYDPQRMDPVDAARGVSRVRNLLAADEFERAFREGRALTLEAAVALALAPEGDATAVA